VEAAEVPNRDALAQPPDSSVILERHPDGVTITVPPLGLSGPTGGLILFSLIFALIGLGLTIAGLAPLLQANPQRPTGVIFVGGCFFCVGSTFFLSSLQNARKRVVLAVVGTQIEGRLEVRDARELRIKESDRLRTIVDGLRAMGAEIEEFDDGFCVTGPQRLSGARIETAGDHRIAMAFSIAALAAEGTTEIVDAGSAAVSFPEFYSTLRRLVDREDVIGD